MRLICPNCGAQYEVDADMIPAEGRDVQCSSCDTTWFQNSPRSALTPSQDLRSAKPRERGSRVRRRPADAAGSGLDILREEAEKETRLRESAFEAQPDLPLQSDEAVEARALAARSAGLNKGQDPEDENDEALKAQLSDIIEDTHKDAQLNDLDEDGDDLEKEIAPLVTPRTVAQTSKAASRESLSRRHLLPDIEEINSTLRPDEHVAEDEEIDEELREALLETNEREKRSSSARVGFVTVAILAAIAVIFYIYGDEIGQRAPGAKTGIASYQAWVDQQRINLDELVGDLVDTLSDVANTSEN